MEASAIRHLRKKDKSLSQLIKNLGSLEFKPKKNIQPFEALVESIVYQQLHGKAAATIFRRVKDLFPSKKFPTPDQFLKMPLPKLRSAGLSEAKAKAILDLSQKTKEGLIPSRAKILKLSDEEVVDRITQVRGIGRWTVEMLLIFKLGRPDILPSTDYAIRKAFSKLTRKKNLAPPKTILAYGERWRPYRTFAALYLWKSLDEK